MLFFYNYYKHNKVFLYLPILINEIPLDSMCCSGIIMNCGEEILSKFKYTPPPFIIRSASSKYSKIYC